MVACSCLSVVGNIHVMLRNKHCTDLLSRSRKKVTNVAVHTQKSLIYGSLSFLWSLVFVGHAFSSGIPTTSLKDSVLCSAIADLASMPVAIIPRCHRCRLFRISFRNHFIEDAALAEERGTEQRGSAK